MSRPAPRPFGLALEAFNTAVAPASTLARVQERWEHAVGPAIAAAARPTAERDGTLTVVCESAVWAQELTLMGADLLARLNAALGTPETAAPALRELRCRCA